MLLRDCKTAAESKGINAREKSGKEEQEGQQEETEDKEEEIRDIYIFPLHVCIVNVPQFHSADWSNWIGNTIGNSKDAQKNES